MTYCLGVKSMLGGTVLALWSLISNYRGFDLRVRVRALSLLNNMIYGVCTMGRKIGGKSIITVWKVMSIMEKFNNVITIFDSSTDESCLCAQSVQCEVNKVFSTSRTRTGPDPRTLGASPNMQFLASAGPGQNSFLLSMLPDTGAGVSFLSERLMEELNIEINRGKRDSYSITDASE